MNNENLTSFNQMSVERRTELARKGGQVKSAKKTLANQLKAWKREGTLTEKGKNKIYKLLNSEEISHADRAKYILKIEEILEHVDMDFKDLFPVLRSIFYMKGDLHKQIYGEKQKIDAHITEDRRVVNFNVNIVDPNIKKEDVIEVGDKS